MNVPQLRIGVAGWSIPSAEAHAFGAGASHLERYATRLRGVEINSSFYRPHRPSTYARWAASVPDDFRFAVKLPKAITHELRLVGGGDLMARFAEETAGLGQKRGPVLVQLPPSLVFEAALAADFFATLAEHVGGTAVCEPRHASWFTPEADALLDRARIARVAADPARVPGAAAPGGWRDLAYFRLHGSPQIYRSAYDAAALDAWAAAMHASGAEEVWTIFDNTAGGAAVPDALALQRLFAASLDT